MSSIPAHWGPALKVFAPEAESNDPALPRKLRKRLPSDSPDQSLSDFFEQVYLVLVAQPRGNDEKTVGLLKDSIEHWKRLTGDPPLRNIDDYTAAMFVQGLIDQPGRKGEKLSLFTVRRHCRQIQRILDFAGPKSRERWGRQNRELIQNPPMLVHPRPDQEAPHGDFSLQEIHAMVAAASQAIAPQIYGVTAGDWWRALIAVACHTGLRIGALMQLRYQDLGIDLVGPYITVWSRSSKGGKGRRQRLTEEALEAIESIRNSREVIFEFPNWTPKNNRWLFEIFQRLQESAGIPKERRRGFHGLRKFHGTAIAGAGEGGIREAQASLGHSSSSTTTGHYVSGETQERLALRALKNVPSTKPAPTAVTDPQGQLFQLD